MPLRSGTSLPELGGATEWLNGEAKREALMDSPTLVHFWAISCPICHDNMSTVSDWRDHYADKGLNVVAVHMPRQPEDLDIEAVRKDAATMNITEPCAIDNQHTLGDRFQNELWPAYFLFDAEGNLKSRAGGYAGLKMIEAPLKRMLDE